MPVIGNGSTPTVQVNVPVPTPVQQKPRAVRPQPVPRTPTPSLPQAPGGMGVPAPEEPTPDAVILPWQTERKRKQAKAARMSREPARFAKRKLPDTYHSTASEFSVVNPAHITDDVRNLAQQAYGSTQDEDRAFVGDGPQFTQQGSAIRARSPRHEVLPILADALQDAGLNDNDFLRVLRTVGSRLDLNDWWHGGVPIWGPSAVIRSMAYDSPEDLARKWTASLPRQQEAIRKEADINEYKQLHASIAPHLEEGYVIRREGGGSSGMRGNPPPGEIWFRPAYRSGQWSHRAQEKHGRKLTLDEYRNLAKTRRAEELAKKRIEAAKRKEELNKKRGAKILGITQPPPFGDNPPEHFSRPHRYSLPPTGLVGGAVKMQPRVGHETSPQEAIHAGLLESRRQAFGGGKSHSVGNGYQHDTLAGGKLADALDEAGQPHGPFFRNLARGSANGIHHVGQDQQTYPELLNNPHPIRRSVPTSEGVTWSFRPSHGAAIVRRYISSASGPGNDLRHTAVMHAPALREWAGQRGVSPSLRAHLINSAEYLESQEPQDVPPEKMARALAKSRR